ncbi:hypothetical protein KSP39_PZI015945 [Platanthera zijinensis]|uniref:Uncharacterized protein n=1 Tax=Platanthera zijinensis TaxID=2320716 RepID=A0AAP0G1H8_9ASPA
MNSVHIRCEPNSIFSWLERWTVLHLRSQRHKLGRLLDQNHKQRGAVMLWKQAHYSTE